MGALSDMLNSIGVCIASVIIWIWPAAKIADPICAFMFAILVVLQCKPLIGDCVDMLMEAAPGNIKVEKLTKAIKKTQEGLEIGEFHLWQISRGKIALSCHVQCNGEPMKVLTAITKVCKEDFKITTLTVQVQDAKAAEEDQMKLELNPLAFNAGNYVPDPKEAKEDHGHGH